MKNKNEETEESLLQGSQENDVSESQCENQLESEEIAFTTRQFELILNDCRNWHDLTTYINLARFVYGLSLPPKLSVVIRVAIDNFEKKRKESLGAPRMVLVEKSYNFNRNVGQFINKVEKLEEE